MHDHQIEVPARDGAVDALLIAPETRERLPGVLQLTDGLGLRPEHVALSRRIAEGGYVVLTPNIFYRTNAMVADGSAYVDFLAAQAIVRAGPMAVVGFCFAGQFALRVAAARSDRIGAAASFHGGGLVTDNDRSPHLVLPRVKARLYFGHAVNDRSMPVEAAV